MSKKRGLSLEEKRTRMLEIFFEKKEFFHLKEIEKIAPKQKGITPMSVKDVLQSLVDDDLVNCEKVGSSSYYWAFPSQALNIKQNKLKRLEKQIQELEEKEKHSKDLITAAEMDRKPCASRDQMLKELTLYSAKKDKLLAEAKQFKDCDPKMIEKLKTDAEDTKEAANRWTDNLLSLKSWIKRKFPIDETQINKQFEIPEDLDYIE